MTQPKLPRRTFVQLAMVGVASLFIKRYSSAAGTLDPTSGRAPLSPLTSFVIHNGTPNPGNFRAIFKDPELKADFMNFLKNVYNIYPEQDLHKLIAELVDSNDSDEAIYQQILARVDEVKPFLSEFTYALPALAKQKSEIAEETLTFLRDRKTIHGYLEIGTPGRYVSELKRRIKIEGDVALINVAKPSFSLLDIVERGQLTPIARYIPLDNYAPISVSEAADASFEVVTNYIGFHHSTLERLPDFIASIHRVLKPGGSLILRDHDVVDEKMNAMVALAHDVFNAGLKNTWEYNHQEVRHFRSLQDWNNYLQGHGFVRKGSPIFQPGDPTKNALMEFIRV